MKRKNILLLISSLTGGGAELVVSNLTKYIDRRRFSVGVCCMKMIGERGEDLQKKGFDITELPKSKTRIGNYFSAFRLRRIVRNKSIDLIHSHSTQGLIDGGIVKFMSKQVRHMHTFHFGDYPRVSKKTLILEKLFSRVPDRLVAVGKEQRKTIATVFGLPNTRIKTIWNGIEIPEIHVDPGQRAGDLRQENGKIVLGSISTLIEQKGITYLLDAIGILSKRRPDFTLWIVGDGPLRRELEEKKTALGLDGLVEFKGWVHNAPATILPQIDIFIQSSLWEAMSMVVLEAMAAGKPVVVTDVGDNKHIVESWKNGVIVKKKDVAGMTEVLERLLTNKPLREELGRRAREKVAQECSVSQMARNYEKLYLELLGEGS